MLWTVGGRISNLTDKPPTPTIITTTTTWLTYCVQIIPTSGVLTAQEAGLNFMSVTWACSSSREATRSCPFRAPREGPACIRPGRDVPPESLDRACRSCMPLLHWTSISVVQAVSIWLVSSSCSLPGHQPRLPPAARPVGWTEPQAWSLRSRIRATTFCHEAAPSRRRVCHAVFRPNPGVAENTFPSINR